MPLPRPELLRIFPHRGAIDHGLGLLPGEALAADGVFTFETLFQALPPPAGKRYVLPLVAQLLLRGVMARSGGLAARLHTDPQSVRAYARSLQELRQAGVTAGHLAGKGSPRLVELHGVLEGYEQALEAAGFYDDADRQRAAVLAVAEGRGGALVDEARRVQVESGASLFGARLDLLRALAARGLEVTVRLPWDAERKAVFAWPEASLHRLEAAEHARLKLHFDDLAGDGPLEALRRAQFSGGEAPGAPARLLEVPSPGEHAAAAAATVARWLRQGVPAHEVVVVVATPELGAAVVQRLEGLGVSSYGGKSPSLLRSLPARALILALELPLSSYPREALIDLLLIRGERVEIPDRQSWPAEKLASRLREAGVRSQRVGGYRQGLQQLGERESARGDVRLEYAAAADHVEALLATLEAVPARADLVAALDAVEALRRQLGLDALRGSRWRWSPDDVLLDGPLLAAEAEVDEAVGLVGDVLLSARQAARVVPSAGPKLSRVELAAWMRLLCGERSLSPRGTRAGSVQILSPADVVGTRFSRLVVAGIDPEVFPRLPPVDSVLTEELRAEINQRLGPRLLQYGALTGRGVLRGEARDVWLWLEALHACRDELCVTYARPDGKAGKSELVDELERSLGAPVKEGFTPTYAGGDVQTLAQARQRWARGRYQPAARLHAVDVPPLVSALDVVLRRDDAEALASLAHRVDNELILTGEGRTAVPLGEAERRRLEARYFDEVLSASRLDALGMCAYRHFGQSILGLQREDVATLGADPRDEGSLAHAALYEVYRDLVAHGGLAAARRDAAAAFARARQVFEAHTGEILREVIIHPLLRSATLEGAWLAVETQLLHDLESPSPFEPLALEYTFDDRPGKASAPVLELEHPGGRGRLRVRGGIDRVDKGGGMLAAIDYKRSTQVRSPGRHFQLPLYLLVAMRDFGDGVSQVRAEWAGLRDARRKPAVAENSEPASFSTATLGQLWMRLDRVLGGDVSPDPDPTELCRRCDVRAVCRFQAVDTPEEGT